MDDGPRRTRHRLRTPTLCLTAAALLLPVFSLNAAAAPKPSVQRQAPDAGRPAPAKRSAPLTIPAKSIPTTAPAPRGEAAEVRLHPLPGRDEKSPPTEFMLKLADERGQGQFAEIESKNGVAHVPPGTYWLTGWRVMTTDGAGRKWVARGGVLGTPSPYSRLSLGAGQKIRLRLGSPMGAAVQPVVRGRTVKMTMSFFGPLGDRCYQVNVDGERPPRPLLKILDEQGREVDKLTFSYG